MSLLSEFIGGIKLVFCEEPKGRMYSATELASANEAYKLAIYNAYNALFEIERMRYEEIYCKGEASRTVMLMCRAMDTNMKIIKSWMDEEFVPKICGKTIARGIGSYKKRLASNFTDPIASATRNLNDARLRAKTISEALAFFLCDTRSTFKKRENMPYEPSGPMDIARWFVEGKHIVESNMKAMCDAIERTLEFMKRHR